MAMRKADDSSFFTSLGISRNDASVKKILHRKKRNSKEENESDSKKFIDDRARYEASIPAEPPLIPRRVFVLTAVLCVLILVVLGGVGFCNFPQIRVDYEDAAVRHALIQNSSCANSCIYAESKWPNCGKFCTAEGPMEIERTLHVAYKPSEANEHCVDRHETLKCLFWTDFIKYEWTEWTPCLKINGEGKSIRKRNLPTEGYMFNFDGMTAADLPSFIQEKDCKLNQIDQKEPEFVTTEEMNLWNTTFAPIVSIPSENSTEGYEVTLENESLETTTLTSL